MNVPRGPDRTGEPPSLTILEVRRRRTAEGWEDVVLGTDRGEIALRHYAVPGSRRAAVFVGGVGGGFDSPVRGRLYPELCGDLVRLGIHAVRVQFRNPVDLDEAIVDVLAALRYLEAEGVDALAVVGHSFGGAVALQAAAADPAVRAVVTLATQGYGTEAAEALPPGCGTLVIHGLEDEVLPSACSLDAYDRAPEPKRLLLLPGVRHGLEEAAGEVRRTVREWLSEHLEAARNRAA